MIAGIIIGVIVSSLFWIWLANKENEDWANYCKDINKEWADYCKILINEAFDDFYKEIKMKTIIDLPEELYKGIEKRDGSLETEYVCDELMKAIDNGIPLPEGHGRLLILDEKLVRKYFTSFSFSCQKWISEVGISNATWKIIEADKEAEK